jgi:putative ABC transport system permease protein
MADIPHNSHIQFDALVSIPTFSELDQFGQHLWHWPAVYTYIRLSNPDALPNIKRQMSEFEAKNLPGNEAEVRSFYFQPLTSIHLHSHLKYELEANGNSTQVAVFVVVAVLIIFIACLNYINLSTARAIKRAREVGIKKVLGAKPMHLVFQFMGESLVFVLFAYILAVGIVVAVLPGVNQILDKSMSFFGLAFRSSLFLCLQAGFLVLIAVLAGAYPAFFLSRFRPSHALGEKQRISGGALRKVLVMAQFAVSVILISGTLIVYQQMKYIQEKNLGFNKENILVVPLQGDKIIDNVDALKERLLQNPDVKQFTTYSNIIGANDRIYSYPIIAEGVTDNKQFEMSILIVDYDFIDTFNLEVVEGRKFLETAMTDREGLIINEAAQDVLKWEDPVGKKLDIKYIRQGEDFSGRVIGVVKDFNLRTLHHRIEPLVMFVSDKNNVDYLVSYISLKIDSSRIPETLEFLRKRWADMESGELFEYTFLDERIERQYQAEQKAMQLITTFSLMAVLIACFGLYGLSSYMAEAKTKEIGIRRVLGASVPGITLMLSKEFLKWILLASVIAIPVAYLAGQKWLQSFAFRIDLGIWIFVFSSVLAMIIAFLTISYQSIKAATANPVHSLRYE